MKYYEIREIKTYSLQLSLEDGKIERPRAVKEHGKAFRILKNGFWGYFTGNVEDEEGLRRAERCAVGTGDADVDDRPFEGRFVLKPERDFEEIALEDKIAFLRELESMIRAEGIVSTRVVYIESVREVRITSSNGGDVYYRVPRCGVVMQAFAKGKTLQYHSERELSVGGFEIAERAIEKAEKVAEIAVKLSNADSPPAGRMNVIMDPSLTGVFIHEAFGHAVEGDHVLQNATVLRNMIGERVADDSVNVYDDPTLKEFGFYPFDDEGYRAERTPIIENGILKNYLNSRESGKRLGGRPGNGRADGLEPPIVRMSNTFIEAGDYSLEELLDEAREGVMLFGSRGGETNPATGFFHFNAQYGFLIHRGEVSGMVRDVSLSGNTLEILREIRLGDEIVFDPGFCGKSGQAVPVSDGGPYALVKAFVGGE
ncbi:TldD/PmbA family protein [Geoglobus acetivorans]|uniref:TldD protein, part of TldE/TldD proteolytic complex n=1 Tax=Geoglobus acetivorans TaxID=565033 RepID=A0A0A7GJB0_GEOAI|nr:TldD protein, part of TldE/TldD proteolytic complex [Geoglobus acetivorans]